MQNLATFFFFFYLCLWFLDLCFPVTVNISHLIVVERVLGVGGVRLVSGRGRSVKKTKMGCVSSRQPRHSPLVNQEDDPDPWHTESSISLSGYGASTTNTSGSVLA